MLAQNSVSPPVLLGVLPGSLVNLSPLLVFGRRFGLSGRGGISGSGLQSAHGDVVGKGKVEGFRLVGKALGIFREESEFDSGFCRHVPLIHRHLPGCK